LQRAVISLSEQSQTILGAFLTEGLKMEETASITGFSVFQIIRGRNKFWMNKILI
jgi:DNA-directed RNA polymerase specialized sigma subunit